MSLDAPRPSPAQASDTWLVHCDGSAFPNPGAMGLGAVLVAPNGTRHTLSEPAAGKGCNNEAEARAVMAALHAAKQLGADCVHIYSDSRVVVDQLTSDGGQPIERLNGLFSELRALLATFSASPVTWIPQHRNSEADALARAAAGLPLRPPASPGKVKARRP
jgi:ribonuclease HI